MFVKCDYDFYDLQKYSWAGAVDTLQTVADNNKKVELIDLLEDFFYGRTPTATEVNDFLWFESDYILQCLGISEEEEDEDEDECEEATPDEEFYLSNDYLTSIL